MINASGIDPIIHQLIWNSLPSAATSSSKSVSNSADIYFENSATSGTSRDPVMMHCPHLCNWPQTNRLWRIHNSPMVSIDGKAHRWSPSDPAQITYRSLTGNRYALPGNAGNHPTCQLQPSSRPARVTCGDRSLSQ